MEKHDVNLEAYINMCESGCLKIYEGMYVAFVDGEFVGRHLNEDILLNLIRKIYPDGIRKVIKVGRSD